MRTKQVATALIVGFLVTAHAGCDRPGEASASGDLAKEARGYGMGDNDVIHLPAPNRTGGMSLSQTLAERRSSREFSGQGVSIDAVSQLLWAGQGITSARGLRAAPSAGALFPLELYLVRADGVYHYDPLEHSIHRVQTGDLRPSLAGAALDQDPVGDAPISIVITGIVSRTAQKYGARAERYVALEAGCAGENISLQAVALGLASVWIGAFDDRRIGQILQLPVGSTPYGIIPIGYPL